MGRLSTALNGIWVKNPKVAHNPKVSGSNPPPATNKKA